MTITFFTTFHQHGMALYGKHWLSTFIRNVEKSNPNVSARIYVEDITAPESIRDRIDFLDFNSAIPDHILWKRRSGELDRLAHPSIKMETIRFSHKAFVIMHALRTIETDYAIWLDGDCVFHEASYADFPQNILDGKFLACQLEQGNAITDSGNHIESGVLIFDMNHPDTSKFAARFTENYQFENLLTLVRPFDGYVTNKTLEELQLPYTNLNEKYGVLGVQGLAENTFRHPELRDRFTHNIGADGKAQYKDWNKVKHADDPFRNLDYHLSLRAS